MFRKKKFKTDSYYSRYFFSYLRESGLSDDVIYRWLGRISDKRKGNRYYTAMPSKESYRRAIHIAIESNGKIFQHPLDEASLLSLMFPTVAHRKESKGNNRVVMFVQRDNKIHNKYCNNVKFERNQIIYICCIEIFFQNGMSLVSIVLS